ncbi:MAG TPA: putative baseplate assembly protein, partial [Blastocatellia bacterium]|nr:putative baseplate assembly protein [Blastocatellia bacterium]
AVGVTSTLATNQPAGGALGVLDKLLPLISKPPSLQPANSLVLPRSVSNSFSVNQDTGPQLITAFRPDLRPALYQGLSSATVTGPSALKIYAFRVAAPLFGSNAPRKLTSISSGVPQTDEWSGADVQSEEDTTVVNLDSSYDGILPGSWVVVDTSAVGKTTDDFPANPPLLIAKAANPKSGIARSAYGISGKTTRIELAKPTDSTARENWIGFPQAPGIVVESLESHSAAQTTSDGFIIIRRTVVYAKAEELALAEAPITKDICEARLELSGLYNGLKSGRWVIIAGERADLPLSTDGVKTAEVVMLSGVEQTFDPNVPGDKAHSTLILANKPAYCYKRDTVTIYGNVVEATHGETRNEVLGSGDSSKSLQEFTLRQSPLTYLAAPTPAGASSTLQVRVNNILWHETDSLDKLGPTDRDYVTETGDDDKTTITFGNGKQGARPATGAENVTAVYRTGIGQPGNVKANQISLLVTRPLGLKAVTNPVRASGGADRESIDQIRSNVPLAVMALDRLVSVQDYQDFARTFAGIGKASSIRLSNGSSQLVHLTIAGTDDIPIDENSDLYRNLLLALRGFGDQDQQFMVKTRELMLLVISAKVRILPDYQFESVASNIRPVLLDTFGFQRRDLGQSVFLSEVISAIQHVPGVAYVDVDVLDSVSESDASDADRLTKKLQQISTTTTKPKRFIFVRGAEPQSQAGCGQTTVSANICPAQLAILSPDVPDTLILTELTA